MLLKEVLDKTTQFFRDKKIETARLDSELLISSALGIRRIDLYLKFDQPLKDQEIETCRNYVRRRTAGESVAHILGYKDFFNERFFVNKNVLIPRPETEIMVEFVIDWIKQNQIMKPNIFDLGSGSGCIGLSLAKAIPESKVTLIEKSSLAIEVLMKNRSQLNLENNTSIIHDDVLKVDIQNQSIDVVVANPPYIKEDDQEVDVNVKKYEPHEALFSVDGGYFDIFTWSEKFARVLKSPGLMIFEIGHAQGEKAKSKFESLKVFNQVLVKKDYSEHDRFIIGEING
jgi:release factor glutamine methyltransferase